MSIEEYDSKEYKIKKIIAAEGSDHCDQHLFKAAFEKMFTRMLKDLDSTTLASIIAKMYCNNQLDHERVEMPDTRCLVDWSNDAYDIACLKVYLKKTDGEIEDLYQKMMVKYPGQL